MNEPKSFDYIIVKKLPFNIRDTKKMEEHIGENLYVNLD